MPALTLANLLLYAGQVAILIGGLALAFAALRLSPAFRLAACRMLLLGLLVLPFQPLLRPADEVPVAPGVPVAVPSRVFDAIDVAPVRHLPWAAMALAVIAGGAALRGLWLLAGLVRLRRLSAAVAGAEDLEPEDARALQEELGTRARVHVVEGVAQPVTFGVRPPVVLLPASLAGMPPAERRAVICHELLHVRRRDWLWVLLEEAVLTALWFHPGVWWLVGELQLAREQVVDRLTVEATGARRAYMDALFAAADAPSAPPLFAGFLRRRQLVRRIVSLAEEVVMSPVRFVAGVCCASVCLVGGGAVALAALPLAPMPQAAGSGPGGPAGASIATLGIVHQVPVEFPAGVTTDYRSVSFEFNLDVAADGAVAAVHLVRFSSDDGRESVPLSTEEALARTRAQASEASRAMGRLVQRIEGMGEAGPASPFERLGLAAADVLREWRFEPPAAQPAVVSLTVSYDIRNARGRIGPVRPVAGFTRGTRSVPPEGTLRVGGAIKPPKKLVNVAPEYPAAALEAKVQGVVVVDVILDAAGVPADVQVLKGVPELDAAAVEAVRQWRFEPTLMNGVPVPVQITVTVNFSLAP
jgi:TonB family protein